MLFAIFGWISAHLLVLLVLLIIFGPIIWIIASWLEKRPDDSNLRVLNFGDALRVASEFVSFVLIALFLAFFIFFGYQRERTTYGPYQPGTNEEIEHALAWARAGDMNPYYKLYPHVDPRRSEKEREKLYAELNRKMYGAERRNRGEWWALDMFSDPPPEWNDTKNGKCIGDQND
jgi:hypothetical protein